MLNMYEIQKKISEIENSGVFNESQMEYIRYASYRNDFDVNLILDNSIPAEYMGTYIKLGVSRKDIEICKYIKEKWHNMGYNPQQLYFVIHAAHLNIDIKNIPLSATVDEIKQIIAKNQEQNQLQTDYKNSKMALDDLQKIQSLNVSTEVKKFLLRVGQNNEISSLLDIGLEKYSIDQIKYFYSVYSVGYNIDRICNPNLSVEQMKQIILKSPESVAFANEIRESYNSRKK